MKRASFFFLCLEFNFTRAGQQTDEVEHAVVVAPETNGNGEVCKISNKRFHKSTIVRKDLCASSVHGYKPWGCVAALAWVWTAIDGVVRQVRPAVVEVIQLAGADFLFTFIATEQGVVETQVECHAPCVSAEVVAFGEPGHGLGASVVFGVVREKRCDWVRRFFQVLQAAVGDIKPGVVACRFRESTVEGDGVVARVGELVTEDGGELD